MGTDDGNLGTVDVNGQPIGGAGGGGGDNYGQVNDLGLNEADAAAWQAMQNGEPIPGADQQQQPPPPQGDNQPPPVIDQPAGGDGEDVTLAELFGRETTPPPKDKDPRQQQQPPAPDADDDELPPVNPTQQTVAYGKYRRDLEKVHSKLKAAKAELANGGAASNELTTLKAEHNKLMGRFELLMEAVNKGIQPKAAEPPKDPAQDDPMPDVEEKPFEMIAWLQREVGRLGKQLTEARGETKKVQDAHVAEMTEREVAQHYVADAQRFAQSEPAFGMAYMYLKDSRMKEMCRIKYRKPLYNEAGQLAVAPDEAAFINNWFRNEEQNIATEAIKNGQSPAELIWSLALDRQFNAAVAREHIKRAQAGQNGGGQPNGGGKAPPQEQQPAKPKPSEIVKGVREGLEASRSLSDGGSAPNHGRLSVKQVAEMDDDRFEELYEALGGKQGVNREILGGPAN